MAKEVTTPKEDALEAENTGLRQTLAQAGIDASQLLAKAGIDASQQEAAARLQRLLLEELHHRVKNTLATVMVITSQSLKNATSMEQGRGLEPQSSITVEQPSQAALDELRPKTPSGVICEFDFPLASLRSG
jgi:hypothetical protein